MLSTAMQLALPVLRDYLDEIGFVEFYKFAVASGCYGTNPHVFSWMTPERAADIARMIGDRPGFALAAGLMSRVSVAQGELNPFEKRLAELLIDAGLLARCDGRLRMGCYQLISALDMPLLIDSCVNYPGEFTHRVYFGTDSLRLALYANSRRTLSMDQVIDLGTGSGVVGLSLARYRGHVTLTDVSPHALSLAHANRLLNHMTDRVQIREERCEDTLRRAETYQVVTFNPPFMALPHGLHAPSFARGLGADGLDYCRMFLDGLEHILAPGGTAYLVAGLLGAMEGPFFVEELRRYVDRSSLCIDVFIEVTTRLAAGSPTFVALGTLLHRDNPGITREQCQREVETLQMTTLRATHTHLAIMVIRRAPGAQRSLRVFNRMEDAQLV